MTVASRSQFFYWHHDAACKRSNTYTGKTKEERNSKSWGVSNQWIVALKSGHLTNQDTFDCPIWHNKTPHNNQGTFVCLKSGHLTFSTLSGHLNVRTLSKSGHLTISTPSGHLNVGTLSKSGHLTISTLSGHFLNQDTSLSRTLSASQNMFTP